MVFLGCKRSPATVAPEDDPEAAAKAEADAEAAKRSLEATAAASPLAPISFLLRFYSCAGVIPGYLTSDKCGFVTSCWKHLIPFGVLFGLLLGAALMKMSSLDGDVSLPESWNETELCKDSSGTSSKFDDVIHLIEVGCDTLFMFLSMALNHRSLASCYRVTTKILATDLDLLPDNPNRRVAIYPNPKLETQHHFTLMIFFTLGSVLSKQSDIKALCYHFEESTLEKLMLQIGTLGFLALTSAYTFALLSVSELVISTILHALTHAMEENLKKNSAIPVATFCDRADRVTRAFNELAQVFGNNMLLLIMFSLIQLLWGAYFIIARLTFGDADAAFLFNRRNVRRILLCIVFIKRMFFLTNAVHKFDKKVGNTLDALSEMETSQDAADSRVASRTWKRLDSVQGLNVRGFFIVDRTMFPALIGHFLTYIIILIQFRMSENMG